MTDNAMDPLVLQAIRILEEVVEDVLFNYHPDYINFRTIEQETGLPRDLVRVICRRLTDQGRARYGSGLFNYDGDVGGAGYAAILRGETNATWNQG